MKKTKLLLILFALLAFGQMAWAQLPTESVSYIDTDGSTNTVNAVSISRYVAGSTIGVANNTTWYYVTGSIDWGNNQLTCTGDLHLILCDGASFSINNQNGDGISGDGTLTIYGQTNQTGQIIATSSTKGMNHTGSITIYGGVINATGDTHGIYAGSNIVINRGNVTAVAPNGNAMEGNRVTINGGIVSATGEGGIKNGIASTTTLGYTNSSDRITATSYLLGNSASTVKVKDGQYMITNNGVIIYGSLDEDKRNAIAGRILSPYTPTEWSGHGESDDPYIIASVNDLNLLSLRTNGGSNDYSDKYYKLGNNITFTASSDWNDASSTESNFTAIGSFSGHFDGDVYTISGLRIRKDDGVGLFSYLAEGAVVENITLNNSRVTGNSQIGGIVGSLQPGATVNNCHVTNTVYVYSKYHYTGVRGGVVGYSYSGTISNCVSEATIDRTTEVWENANDKAGGIVGVNDSGTLTGNLVIGANITCYTENYGAIAGNSSGTLTNNYYRACTINGTANATSVGCNGADVTASDGALSLHTISTPNTITIETSATLTYGAVDYWAQGKTITLSGGLNEQPTVGWQKAYFVNGVANTSDPFTPSSTFAITPARDIEITIGQIHADWANEYNNSTAGSSSDNPYKIYFTDQLDLLSTRVNAGNDYSGNYFRLMNNLTYDYAGLGATESNYTAIGSNTHPFKGHFDGDNHTISGIRIYKANDDYQGLFGCINTYNNNPCEVKNLTLDDAVITAKEAAGGIVGGMYGGSTLYNCHVTSAVSIHAVASYSYCHGGIAGSATSSTISHCTSAATLTINSGASDCYQYGAIAGGIYNNTTLTDNSVIGATIPATTWAGHYQHGAIVGNSSSSSLIRNYYYGCKVASGNVITPTGVGCGGDESMADITTNDGALPVFTISVPNNVSFNATATVTYNTVNYYKEGVSVSLNGGLSGTPVNPGTKLTYYVYGAALLSSNLTPTNTFNMQAADAVVTVDEAPADWAAEQGAGDTEGNPYKIYYTEQLDLLATRVNSGTDYAGKYFKLMNNLTYDNTKQNNYTAIGNSQAHPFRGHFDGNNKTISGIRIYKSGDSYGDQWQAVFGCLNDSTSEVKNLTVADADITAYNFAGGIVGFLEGGTITNCHATSTVFIRAVAANANSHGGIVGDATAYNTVSEISHCTSSVTLTNTSSGNVKYYGAIAGAIRSGVTTSDNFAIGATVPSCADNDHGALVGYNNGATLARNYYHNCTVAGIANATNKGCDNANVVDNDGALPVFTLSLASGISADVDTTLIQDEVNYYKLGTTVSLSCATPAPAGYCYVFSVNDNPIAGNTFDMEANSNVSVATEIIDWIHAYSGTACDPYLIGNATQWNALAASVKSGTTYSDAFFKLTADISINTIVGDFTNNDGDHYYPFSGTFDGNGHTLHVTLYRYHGNWDYVAPFACVSGATIKNLHITGSISTDGKRPASITSFVVENSTIENCWSEVDISSSREGDIDAGGLVARVNKNKTVTITDCLFSGSITYSDNDGFEGGGMVGYTQDGATAKLTNCYFAPSSISFEKDSNLKMYMFVGGERDYVNINNCYYNDVAASHPKLTSQSGTNASNVSSTILRNLLGNGWEIKNYNVVPIIAPYTFSGEGTEESPYIIASEADWNGLANNVYLGEIHSCDYFKMSNDISVTTMVGSHPDENTFNSFDGTFDGDGHTLNVTYSGSGDCTAPFTCISGATIKNLHITGTIATTGMRPASIASFVVDNSTISNCWSEVAISSSHNSDIDAGGFVARVNENKAITLNGCAFTGSITYSNNGYEGGGMVGYTQSGATATLNNCLFAPSAISITNYNTSNDWTKHYMFVGGRVRGTCPNCYYNDVAAATSMVKEGKQAHSITGGSNVTVENAGTPTTVYNVSSITGYGTGIKYNNVLYAGNGDNVTLSLEYTVPGYDATGYEANNGGSLTLNGSNYILIMPDADVVITATGTTAADWDGDGLSWATAYLIYNKGQLDMLASRVNAGNDYSGKYFKVMNNITYTMNGNNTNYTVIGNANNHKFNGHFDGQNFTVSGVVNSDSQEVVVKGLFGYLGSGAEVKNIVLSNAKFFMGRPIGSIAGNNEGTVTNCQVTSNVELRGTLNSSYIMGGIVGTNQSTGTVSHCSFAGIVNRNHYNFSNNDYNYGGIVGGNYGTLTDNFVCGATIYQVPLYTTQSNTGYGAIAGFHHTGTIARNYYTACTTVMIEKDGYNYIQIENATGIGSGGYTQCDITANDGAVPGNVRTISGYGDSEEIGWAFIASPLTATTAPTSVENLFSASEYDLYRLEPSNSMWENYKQSGDHYHFSLENGRGYLYATQEQKTVKFIGATSSAYNLNDTKEVTLGDGFNLVGNPFPRAAYINKSYYTLNENGSAVLTTPAVAGTAISPCYGVVVEATGSETLTFSTTPQTVNAIHNGNLNIALAQTTVTRSGADNKTIDNAIVSFNEGSDLGKFYFGHQDANIYIPQGRVDYAIAFSDKHGEMPLNFKATENGSYSLTINPEGVDMAYLHLIDNLTGNDVDLLVDPSYTFSGQISDYASRFKLVFVANDAQIGGEGSDDFAFISNGQLIITGLTNNSVLQIIDLTGRVLSSRNASNHISTDGLTAGVYVLRLIDGENVRTQKIVVK